MHNLAPPARKVTVYLAVPGKPPEVREVSPVDAREYVAQGWSYDPPEAASTLPPELSAQLEALSVKQLQEIAKKAGVKAEGKKSDLVAALLPHLAAGAVSLEDVGLRPPVSTGLPLQAAI